MAAVLTGHHGNAVSSLMAESVPGGLLQGVLGEKALQGSNVMVHPFLVAGWAGLVSTSLNLLPVGSIDGGRIVQVWCQLWLSCCRGAVQHCSCRSLGKMHRHLLDQEPLLGPEPEGILALHGHCVLLLGIFVAMHGMHAA
jgi:membrane-associated protease RseP (regulator of RpoE activity)